MASHQQHTTHVFEPTMASFQDSSSASAGVSSRLHRIRAIPGHAYGGAHMALAKNLFTAANPSGNVPMAVAENRLLNKEMIDRLNAINHYPPYILCYTDSRGLPAVRMTVAEFLRERVFRLSPETPVHASNLTISDGCVALLYQLSYLLFEPTDSLLIPSPYYPAFDRDFLTIGEVVSIEVFKNPGYVSFGLSEESLQAAYDLSVSTGKRPKGLLLTNPCNPTGTMYTPEELLTAVRFCRSHGMHLLCDEVYGLSVHDSSREFHSVVSVLNNELGNDVHVMWSMSKDFGCSGIRLGILYSQNDELNAGVAALNDTFMCSNICQFAVSTILSDREFIDSYIRTLRSRLHDSHSALVAALADIKTTGAPDGIQLAMPACAGIFVFVDLRSLLKEPTPEAEHALFRSFIERGIVMTPGLDCHAAVPGYFRLCFAWVEKDCLLEGIRRIKEYAREIGVLLP
jgi:aspartate/methionine/tyrosine aminotransferase